MPPRGLRSAHCRTSKSFGRWKESLAYTYNDTEQRAFAVSYTSNTLLFQGMFKRHDMTSKSFGRWKESRAYICNDTEQRVFAILFDVRNTSKHSSDQETSDAA